MIANRTKMGIAARRADLPTTAGALSTLDGFFVRMHELSVQTRAANLPVCNVIVTNPCRIRNIGVAGCRCWRASVRTT